MWKLKRFNEICVLGGGEIFGSRCDIASNWYLVYLCFFPIDGLSGIFHGYYADGYSYSLVFWEFCTSLVARFVVQNSFKYRRLLGRYYNKCLWGRPAWAVPITLIYWCIFWHRWKLLSLTILKRMRKRVATKEFVRKLRGSISQNLISDLVWTSFAPRSDLVKIAASQNPARRGFGKALQWSAAVVVACVAASGQGAVFGQRSKRFCLA